MAVIELGFPSDLVTGANNTVMQASHAQVTSWPSITPPGPDEPAQTEGQLSGGRQEPTLGWFTWHGGKVNSCSDADQSEWRCLAHGVWTAGNIAKPFPTFPWGAGKGGGGDPIVLFDNGNASAGEQSAIVVGTASHFMASSHITSSDGQGRINAGLLGSVQEVPKGFVSETLIVASMHGVNAAVSDFGGALLRRSGKNKTRPADFTSDYLGYYTDNGAYLYYHFNGANATGYTTGLLDVLAAGKRVGVPLRYLQFDSW
jgi:hypothetical protein